MKLAEKGTEANEKAHTLYRGLAATELQQIPAIQILKPSLARSDFQKKRQNSGYLYEISPIFNALILMCSYGYTIYICGK